MSIQKNTPNFLKHSGLSFTTLINNTLELIKDPATLGIYCHLASKPPGWQIHEAYLQNRFDKGRDFIRTKLSELKKLGLLKTESIKDNMGKIIRWETTLINYIPSQITENPLSGIQITENPAPGKTRHLENPPHINKRKKEEIKENIYIGEPINFTGYKENETKALEEKVEANQKETYKQKAIEKEQCIEAFETLWNGLDVTIEEAYEACQEYWETKNEIVNWGRFVNFLKNPNSKKAFEPIENKEELKKKAIERERKEEEKKEYDKRKSHLIMTEIRNRNPEFRNLKTILGVRT
jgi:hypothetical protein